MAPKAKETAEVEAKAEDPGPEADWSGPRCRTCGYWDDGPQYGLDHRSGFCLHWQKLTDKDFGCEHHVDRDELRRRELEMAEEMGLLDEDDIGDVW